MLPLPFCRCRTDKNPQLSYENAIAINPLNALASASSARRKKRSVAEHGKLWPTGSTLNIAFLGAPAPELREAIIDVAVGWLAYGNLRFRFMKNNAPEADITILTTHERGPINECSIGTDCLLDRPAESMVLTVRPDNGEYFTNTVLHEFGHALGAQHEHQHPDARIPWNRQRLLELHTGAGGWTEQDVDEQYFNPLEVSGLLMTDYDPLSVMHYPVSPALTDGLFEIPLNTELSEKDKTFMRLAYPY